jgi:hypothetical protein
LKPPTRYKSTMIGEYNINSITIYSPYLVGGILYNHNHNYITIAGGILYNHICSPLCVGNVKTTTGRRERSSVSCRLSGREGIPSAGARGAALATLGLAKGSMKGIYITIQYTLYILYIYIYIFYLISIYNTQ